MIHPLAKLTKVVAERDGKANPRMRADETGFIRQNTRPVYERVLEDDFPIVHGSSLLLQFDVHLIGLLYDFWSLEDA